MRRALLRRGTLEELFQELDHAATEAEAVASGLSPEEFRARPVLGGWSIAQCIEHLRRTTDAFLPLLDEALARDSSNAGRRQSHRLGLMGAILVWLMEPPSRMRTRTPPAFDPPDPESDSDVVGRFRAGQNQLGDFISRCRGRQLERTSVVSPFNASVHYSVYEALRILAAHQRRHLWQARRVREVISSR